MYSEIKSTQIVPNTGVQGIQYRYQEVLHDGIHVTKERTMLLTNNGKGALSHCRKVFNPNDGEEAFRHNST